MAGWLAILLELAGATAAASVLGRQVLWPLWRFARRADKMLPLLITLTDQLERQPDHAKILAEIVGQVRSDSGSSLLDRIIHLETAAVANAANNGATIVLLERLTGKVDAGAGAAVKVADDLAASHRRADAITGSAGESADAASRSPDTRPTGGP